MMDLKALKLPETIVKTSGGDLVVRGLNIDDIARLARTHLSVMGDLFDYVKFTVEGGVAVNAGTSIVMSLLDMAPDFMAEVIALCAGDGDQESISIAKGLNISVQIEVLEAVGKNTFTSEGGSKKVVETVIRILQESTGPLAALAT